MKSIRGKLYLFIAAVVIFIASGSIILSYAISSKQIDDIYKHITTANAENFAATLDGDFLADLRVIFSSPEFQRIRDEAAEQDNNLILQGYMEELGIWEQYMLTQRSIDRYISNMNEIEYLYVVVHGDKTATLDMFLMDDSSNNLYDCAGRWEERETAYYGMDLTQVEPTISYSDEWGWLVSDFAPVYDSHGNVVCIVGCDVRFDEIAASKARFITLAVLGTVALAALAIAVSLFVINRYLIKPLKAISEGIKGFNPAAESTDANILNLNMDRQDEIGEIYENIRSNQFRIVDYIKDMNELKTDLEDKDSKISTLSMQSFKDALTNVGNKGAFLQKMSELSESNKDYAIVMVDINNLKEMNDKYGHKAGDWYIQGCCNLLCKTFRHSPIYRIGGDEFVIIVDAGDYPNRILRFDELTKAFEICYQKETEKPWEKLSAACGMAENASDDYSAELVFKRADKAMYEAKSDFKKKYGSYR